MDPDETLKQAASELESGRLAVAAEFLGYYAEWRRRGGFAPAQGDAKASQLQKRLLAARRMSR